MGDDAITVGSFDFPESVVLAEIYSQALEANGYRVVRAFGLGPREFVSPALTRGLIEVVPEYAGTAATFISLGAWTPSDDVEETHARLVDLLSDGTITALSAAPAQDANTFVVTRATATLHDLHSLSDLAPVAHDLTFGGPPECLSRPLCLAGLKDVYGLAFGEVVELDTGGPVTRQALRSGAIDIALLFTTDPLIDEHDFVELFDDRGLQPAENVTPLVRTEIIERWGEGLVAVFDAVSARLTTEAVRGLNKNLLTQGADVAAVAASWLRSERFT